MPQVTIRRPFGELDVRELVCEKVSSPGPERHPGRIPTGEAAVAIELYFV